MDRRHIETFRDINKQYRFRFVADNGEVIAQGEAYHNLHDMMDTLNEYFPEWTLTVEPEQVLKEGS